MLELHMLGEGALKDDCEIMRLIVRLDSDFQSQQGMWRSESLAVETDQLQLN